MQLTIERKNGDILTNKDIGLVVSRFDVSPPALDTTTESIAGRHGNIDLGSTYLPREIELEGYFKSYDFRSYPIYKDRLYKAFASEEAFYLIDSRQPWKRWLVKLSGQSSIDRIPMTRFGEVSMSFETMGMPFSTSAATSLEPRVWEDNGWFWGSGISWSDEDFVYTTESFNVPNYGDVIVNPRFMELIIRFSGASTDLRIQNLSTGDDWQYTGTTASEDIVTINGIRSTKNGISIIRDTNKQLLRLATGDNAIQVTGATGEFTISFEFRFAYL